MWDGGDQFRGEPEKKFPKGTKRGRKKTQPPNGDSRRRQEAATDAGPESPEEYMKRKEHIQEEAWRRQERDCHRNEHANRRRARREKDRSETPIAHGERVKKDEGLTASSHDTIRRRMDGLASGAMANVEMLESFTTSHGKNQREIISDICESYDAMVAPLLADVERHKARVEELGKDLQHALERVSQGEGLLRAKCDISDARTKTAELQKDTAEKRAKIARNMLKAQQEILDSRNEEAAQLHKAALDNENQSNKMANEMIRLKREIAQRTNYQEESDRQAAAQRQWTRESIARMEAQEERHGRDRNALEERLRTRGERILEQANEIEELEHRIYHLTLAPEQ